MKSTGWQIWRHFAYQPICQSGSWKTAMPSDNSNFFRANFYGDSGWHKNDTGTRITVSGSGGRASSGNRCAITGSVLGIGEVASNYVNDTSWGYGCSVAFSVRAGDSWRVTAYPYNSGAASFYVYAN